MSILFIIFRSYGTSSTSASDNDSKSLGGLVAVVVAGAVAVAAVSSTQCFFAAVIDGIQH